MVFLASSQMFWASFLHCVWVLEAFFLNNYYAVLGTCCQEKEKKVKDCELPLVLTCLFVRRLSQSLLKTNVSFYPVFQT